MSEGNAAGETPDAKTAEIKAAEKFSRCVKIAAEAIAAAAAATAVVSLALAFVYDLVSVSIVDARLMRMLVLSDHIETAIALVPLVVLSIFFSVALSFVVDRRYREAPRESVQGGTPQALHPSFLPVVIALGVVTAGGVAVAAYVENVPLGIASLSLGALLLTALLFLSGPGERWWERRPLTSRTPFSLTIALSRLFGSGIAILLAITVLFGIFAAGTVLVLDIIGSANQRKILTDVVTLDRGGSIKGYVFRVMDRGTIIITSPPFRRVFVPKEQV